MAQSKHLPFWILTVSVLCALVLPRLMQDGMFMDGLLYACISKNLSEGLGSFWFPHFSVTGGSFFDHQPPLGFGIQSVFFRIFGNSIYTERLYSFLTCIVAAYLLVLLWHIIFREDKEIKQIAWLPILLWITIPVCPWAYSNNMLENTMAIFDLLAVIFIMKFFQRQNLLFLLFAGVFIFLASLTKGFPGMFPLCGIFFGWLIYRNISFLKMLFYSILLLLVPFAIYFFLLRDETIRQSISSYLNHRVVNSIKNVSTVENRFYLLYRLFVIELLPSIIFSLIVIFFMRRKAAEERHCESPSFTGGRSNLFKFAERLLRSLRSLAMTNPNSNKHFYFFLLLGISASFPLIVTLEQRGFYLVTSFPYFATALALLTAPLLSYYLSRINICHIPFKIFRIFSVLLLTGVLTFSLLKIGKAGRDENMLHDVYLIGKEIPRGTIVGSTLELRQMWNLQEYLNRHFYICMTDEKRDENEYLLLKSEKEIPDGIRAEKTDISTKEYHLYKIVK